MKQVKTHLTVFFKGIAMGAADVVPGVSGGTIAFITGIYETLLDSVNGINLGLLKILKKEGIAAAWKSFNGNFLVALFAGIGISLLGLAQAIEWLLENEPIKLWAFFFGLVLASIIYIGRQLEKWSFGVFLCLLIGTAAAYTVTILPPFGNSEEPWYLFICGMIAICAMILPGISGSFILLLLGAYQPVIEALSERNFTLLAVVGSGCVVGLLLFSRLLKWLFVKYKNLTIAVLTGFLIGSLNKIWPWKKVEQVFVKHAETLDEKIQSVVETSVLPSADYQTIATYSKSGEVLTYSNQDPQILWALVLIIAGFSIIFIMEFMAIKLKKNA